MFDLNLLGKPGLQSKKVDSTISFLKESQHKGQQKSIPIIDKKPKSRIQLLIFSGLFIAIFSAIGFLYLVPFLNKNNKIELPINQIEISQNEIVSGLIDLLLNESLSPLISKINFQKELISIQFEVKDDKLISKLLETDFYGIHIRTKIDQYNDQSYSYKIPWKGVSNPANSGLSQIKDQIGERFVLSNSYDFQTESYILIINEFQNVVSILLRLHDSNILQNFEINIVPGPDEFTTISLKHF